MDLGGLDEDWAPAEEAKWELKGKNYEDGKNPRFVLKVNAPTTAPYMQIITPKEGPPLAVIIVRADLEIPALGVLAKMNTMIQQFQRKMEISKAGRLAFPAGGRLPPPPGGRA